MNLKALSVLALTGLVLTSLAGCGGDQKQAAGKAGGEQKLVMYWSALDDWMAKDVAEFQKDTGIKVEAVRMSSGEVIGRLKSEKANTKADIWFGGAVDGQIAAKTEGLIDKYVSPNAAKIPAKYKDKEGKVPLYCNP